jgi:hypothetical protein
MKNKMVFVFLWSAMFGGIGAIFASENKAEGLFDLDVNRERGCDNG